MNIFLRKLLFLSILLILSVSHAGEIEEGIRYFKDGNYEKARVLTESEQTEENMEAQYCVGLMYRDGLGVKKHEEIAAWWLEKPAKKNYVPAQYALAEMYSRDKKNSSKERKAIFWYGEAAKNGHPVAQYKIAEHLFSLWQRSPEQTRQAIEWYRQAAKNGQPEAANKLAFLYEQGKEVPEDLKEARKWAENSARQNNPQGMSILGRFYINGIGGAADIKKGTELINKAAATGDPEAQFQLAENYRSKLSDEDNTKAVDFYTRAALQNHAKATHKLVNIHQFGLLGQPVNKQEAEKWQARFDKTNGAPHWKKKAEDTVENYTGYLALMFLIPFALLFYGIVFPHRDREKTSRELQSYNKDNDISYLLPSQPDTGKNPGVRIMQDETDANGPGVDKNMHEALMHLVNTSDDNSHASFLLGTLFEKGEGVPQKMDQAIYWYQKSALMGDKHALNRLGILHATGKGLEKDLEKARQYFEKSVEAGFFKANANLGWLFHCGLRTGKNDEKAFLLTRKCAKKRCPAAQYNLAVSYRFGLGTAKDNVNALKWYRQSALCGQPEAVLALIGILGNGLLDGNVNMKEARYWQEEANTITRKSLPDILLYPDDAPDGNGPETEFLERKSPCHEKHE